MSHQMARFLFLHPNADLFLDRMEESLKKGMILLIRSVCLVFGFYHLFFQFPGDIFRMINLLAK